MRTPRYPAPESSAAAACVIGANGSSPATRLHIGISGWTYAGWRGVFYPNDLAQKHELHFAIRTFNSIEINGSFYSLQRPTSYEVWHVQTPPNFVCVRLHGAEQLHVSGYSDAQLEWWRAGIECWRRGKVHAPFDAKKLAAMLQ